VSLYVQFVSRPRGRKLILHTLTALDLQPCFWYEGKKPYYCLIAPTYEGHWIMAFHDFVRAAMWADSQSDRSETDSGGSEHG
jgi:hypothetical protein